MKSISIYKPESLFCKLVKEAIDDEAKGVTDYADLLSVVDEIPDEYPTPPIRDADIIQKIQNDEKWHKEMLQHIYNARCRRN